MPGGFHHVDDVMADQPPFIYSLQLIMTSSTPYPPASFAASVHLSARHGFNLSRGHLTFTFAVVAPKRRRRAAV